MKKVSLSGNFALQEMIDASKNLRFKALKRIFYKTLSFLDLTLMDIVIRKYILSLFVEQPSFHRLFVRINVIVELSFPPPVRNLKFIFGWNV